MSNININSLFERFSSHFFIVYLILLLSLSSPIHASTMHVTCGTDIELTCPIRFLKKSEQVISWFRPNSSQSHLQFIAIGDILFPEYATIGRFNLISSSTSSRLLINNVQMDDQGIYTCKSSSTGQHRIKLIVNSQPHISPSSPLFLYPVNRTFTITCSLLCDNDIDFNRFLWLINGELLDREHEGYEREILSPHTERLTVYLNKKNLNFIEANYTCAYGEKEASIYVRRRTKEEFHRLPRQPDSSLQYLFQITSETMTTYRQDRTAIWTIIFLSLFFVQYDLFGNF